MIKITLQIKIIYTIQKNKTHGENKDLKILNLLLHLGVRTINRDC